jgi:hypothetical protein
MRIAAYDLNQKLPADAVVSGSAVWSRYRQYPVFSRPWLYGRSVMLCSILAGVSAFMGLGLGLMTQSVRLGLTIFAVELAGLTFIACAGPALATYIRHRNLPAAQGRLWVTLAILAGIALSLPIDLLTSSTIERLMAPWLNVTIGFHTTELGASDGAIVIALNVAVRLLIYGLLGGGLTLRTYFTEQRRWLEHRHRHELETARAQAYEADLRLGVLQAQVEPHFLFNTLASLRVLIEQDPPRATAALDALVSFLRATIPQFRGPAATHATLGQQLEVCRSYLEVMRIRMGERLHYVIDAETRLLGNAFPPAILITLVENAIKHGLEPKPGPGLIEVRARDAADRLLLEVLDNGAGLRPGLGSGMGLVNVREQLANRFGARASLRLHTLADQRTCAEVIVPNQTAHP